MYSGTKLNTDTNICNNNILLIINLYFFLLHRIFTIAVLNYVYMYLCMCMCNIHKIIEFSLFSVFELLFFQMLACGNNVIYFNTTIFRKGRHVNDDPKRCS